MMPRLLYQRLDELGADFAIIYPTAGLRVPRISDDDTRRAVVRAHNIVTADYFGLDAEVNAAIVKGVSAGFVSSVSLLVNFPSFGEACDLARRHGFTDRIGLHFNVTEGRPLTDLMRRCERF